MSITYCEKVELKSGLKSQITYSSESGMGVIEHP